MWKFKVGLVLALLVLTSAMWAQPPSWAHKPEGRPLKDPTPASQRKTLPPADGAVMDVLIVVAPGLVPDAQVFAQALVDQTNADYAASGIASRQRLVGAYVPPVYQPTDNTLTDLYALQSPTDGQLDEVHSLRNSLAADLVHLVGRYSSACGQGWITASATYAFSVSDVGCALANRTFAHETGHNIGLNHDPANAADGGATAYAYGFIAPDCSFRTIMAYPVCGPRVGLFSDPARTFNGQPTGTATQNNAQVIRDRAATVAAFRGTVVVESPKPTKPCRGKKCR